MWWDFLKGVRGKYKGQPSTQEICFLRQEKEEIGQSNECIVMETFLDFALCVNQTHHFSTN
jgi:hypothetical protein